MKLDKPIICSNIILWRHAEAVDATDIDLSEHTLASDMARALTPKGQRQAKQMARWLKQNLPENTLIYSSAALRAFQTAQALNDSATFAKINVHATLSPNANLQEILKFLAGFTEKNVLLVGHQPYLGNLASKLLGLELSDLDIKKGAIWWLRLKKMNQSKTNKTFCYELVDVQAPN